MNQRNKTSRLKTGGLLLEHMEREERLMGWLVPQHPEIEELT